MRPVGPVLAAVLVALGLAAADVHLLGDRQTFVPPPNSVVEGFVRAVAMGREDRAAPYLAEELRKKVTEEDLQRYGEKIAGGPGTVREVRGETDWMAGDRASATVLCRSRTGEWRLRFGLHLDAGLWRITELEPPR
jgi:hypothetical protein